MMPGKGEEQVHMVKMVLDVPAEAKVEGHVDGLSVLGVPWFVALGAVAALC